VDAVAAAVLCGARLPPEAGVVALSKDGSAKIHTKVTMPGRLRDASDILLRERYAGKDGGWLAATSADLTESRCISHSPRQKLISRDRFIWLALAD
jgi:hypothetical protein